MRFRPIGFGKGNPGTIGSSSSSSEVASTTDSDPEEPMGDAPPAFRRPVTLNEEDNDGSSSSDEEMEDAPEDVAMISAMQKSSHVPQPRPTKRKLSDLKDDQTSNSMS